MTELHNTITPITPVPPAKPPTSIVGASSSIEHLRSVIDAVSHRSCTVLVLGESGTGKELVAQSLHEASDRAHKPFVPIDCTTLRDSLFESQLFGHVKGAFTGADQPTLGYLRAADGGTVLLDEIGDLPPQVQAKLLRFLQERTVVPLGGVKPIPVNVRLIAATHRDLRAMVDRGEFRQDLYYRLNVVSVEVPPLRHRLEDAAHLSQHFLNRMAAIYDGSRKTLSSDALTAICSYNWPGNVRELANAIEHGYVLADGPVIRVNDLPDSIKEHNSHGSAAASPDASILPLAVVERDMIARALDATDGQQAAAARLLQIERRRLYRKIRLYNLERFTQSRRIT